MRGVEDRPRPKPREPEEPPTMDELIEWEPHLRGLLRLAEMIGDGGGSHFCANAVWYTLFKPRLFQLVGWERIDRRGKVYSGAALLGEGEPELWDDWPEHEAELQSSAAYSVAYQAIYEPLPSCRNCSCW